MTFLNIANVWDMLKCPYNAIFLEFKIPLSNYAPFSLFKGGGGEFSSSWVFFSKPFFMHTFFMPNVPLMRKGIQCIWI